MVNLPENSEIMIVDSKTEDITPEQSAKVENLLKEGRALYKDLKLEEAAEKLGLAASEASTLYGIFHSKCYEPNYYYGCTLIEIARSEMALMNLPTGETEDEEDEQETDVENPDKEGESENVSDNSESTEKKMDQETENLEAESTKLTSDKALQEAPEEASEEAEVTLNADETLDDDEVKENEDESNTKVAWEVLEVARTICQKQEETSEWLLKKADVFTALGNCLIINEDVEGAIREYTSSLEILTQNLLPHDRKLAETYFSMGQAYKTAADFTNALVNLQKAADVFKQAIEHSEKNPESGEDVSVLKKLLTDILDCIEDAKDSDVSIKKQIELQKVEIRTVLTKLMDHTEVNDVTNLLVRKGTKRPAADPEVDKMESEATNIKEPEGKKIRED